MSKTKPVEWDLDLEQAHRILGVLKEAKEAALKLGDKYNAKCDHLTPTGREYCRKTAVQLSKALGLGFDIRHLEVALDNQTNPICGVPVKVTTNG